MFNGKAYVGLTTKTLDDRFNNHVQDSKRPKGSRSGALCKAIAKYGKDYFRIQELDTASSKEELCRLEKQHIIMHNTLSPSGYNLTKGGEWGELSPDTIAKISKKLKGRVKSEKELANLRFAIKHKRDNSKLGKNFKPSREISLKYSKTRGSYKPFAVYRKEDGAFVGSYEMQQDAIKELKLESGSVSMCLNGTRKHHKGYLFRLIEVAPKVNGEYANIEAYDQRKEKREILVKKLKAIGHYKPFSVYRQSDGAFFGRYETQVEATEKLDLNDKVLSLCILGKTKSSSVNTKTCQMQKEN